MASIKELREEWFSHPNWWFKATVEDDLYISQKYRHLLDAHDEQLKEDVTMAIIIHDQLPRHVFRKEPALHIITYFLEKALQSCGSFKHTDSLSTAEWVFHMLPFRHTNDVIKVRYVMQQGWERLTQCKEGEDVKLLKRFLKATYQRCPLGHQAFWWKYHTSTFSETHSPFYKSKAVSQHPIVKTIRYNLESCKHQRVVLSLSGGVDSMVLSVALAALKHELDLDITCVMINYANRLESDEEEAFVVSWCQDVLGLPLITRKIEEIQREPCRQHEMRELYETYTRNIRYACYKQVWKDEAHPLVLLGHNKDDCFENILTNLVQQKKYDNLAGMSIDSMTDNIRFLRPMLNVDKKDIYAFAEAFNVPHLPDSTVTWCQRGIIRDNVRPVLQKWDARCVGSFFEASQVMSELFEVAKLQVSLYKKRCIEVSKACWKLDIEGDTLPLSKIFWRMFLHDVTGIHVSHRSLSNLIERMSIRNGLDKYCIEMHKHVRLFMNMTSLSIQVHHLQ